MSKEILKQAEERMEKAHLSLKKELATLRAGRANVAILDPVQVEYYGSPTPLNQVANVNTPEARLILITPWDKSMVSEIEKAIQRADLGLAPSSDGTVIRLAIPPLTEERRKELVKLVKKYTEEGKVALRNIRHDTNEQLKKQEKDGALTEDDLRGYTEDVQTLTDKFVKQLDQTATEKEQEIMEV